MSQTTTFVWRFHHSHDLVHDHRCGHNLEPYWGSSYGYRVYLLIAKEAIWFQDFGAGLMNILHPIISRHPLDSFNIRQSLEAI